MTGRQEGLSESRIKQITRISRIKPFELGQLLGGNVSLEHYLRDMDTANGFIRFNLMELVGLSILNLVQVFLWIELKNDLPTNSVRFCVTLKMFANKLCYLRSP